METRKPDVFDAIATRDAAPKAKRFRKTRRYQVTDGTRFSYKLHTYQVARKIVNRLRARGYDAWMSCLTFTEESK